VFNQIFGLLVKNSSANRRKKRRNQASGGPKSLCIEPLEDRRMLAVLTVNAIFDQDGIVNDGTLTLREAIAYVNQTAIAESQDGNQIVGIIGQNDLIVFDQSLSGKRITLGIDSAGNTITFPGFENGELDITESVTIRGAVDGTTTQYLDITIDAKGNDNNENINNGGGSSVFDIRIDTQQSQQSKQVTLAGLTITGGDVFGVGGGVSFVGANSSGGSSATLTILDSVIVGNHAVGAGGGVYALADVKFDGIAQVNIIGSTIEGNISSASGNLLSGDEGGGGIYMLLSRSTQITRESVFNLIDSTVSGNEATFGQGGGVWVAATHGGTFNATNSTISGNSAPHATQGQGGGLWISRQSDSDTFPDMVANLDHVTITNNDSPTGGGLFSDDTFEGIVTRLNNTIVSGNRVAENINSSANNITGQIDSDSNYNLTGTGISPAGVGNIFNNDPGLAELGDYGGPTKTHLPMVSSDAVDAGEFAIGFNPAEFDQRGEPYVRVVDIEGVRDTPQALRVDIGAVELQAVFGFFNQPLSWRLLLQLPQSDCHPKCST